MERGLKGFTLIEIIVVLIIVGILAAIALPAIFNNIKKSKGAEALLILKEYKDSYIPCASLHGTIDAGCLKAGMSSANFTYSSSCATGVCSYTAQGNASAGFINGTDYILMILYDATNPTASFTCNGVFQGIC